jgi:hypothetical protein
MKVIDNLHASGRILHIGIAHKSQKDNHEADEECSHGDEKREEERPQRINEAGILREFPEEDKPMDDDDLFDTPTFIGTPVATV